MLRSLANHVHNGWEGTSDEFKLLFLGLEIVEAARST